MNKVRTHTGSREPLAFESEKPSPSRSAIMARVRSSNTGPEFKVRSALHKLGYRYMLHNKRLIGTPDLCFPSRRVVIFVHGCFWHRHPNCKRASTPATRSEYWLEKFRRNVARDSSVQAELEAAGWKVITIWECELKSPTWLARVTNILDELPAISRGDKIPNGAALPSSTESEHLPREQ